MQRPLILFLITFICISVLADTLYVSTSGTSIAPYSSWETAATNIQDAVNTAMDGDIVLVTNGVYEAGSAVTPGYNLTNRVCITNSITVQSVNGPEETIIDAVGEMRGVYLLVGTLNGFCITNGITWQSGGTWQQDRSGGGLWIGDGATATNCMVSGCEAATAGGVFLFEGGTLAESIITDNISSNEAGGVRCESGGTIIDCLIKNNTAISGGGGMFLNGGDPLVERCTIQGNQCTGVDSDGGGIWLKSPDTIVRNSLMIGNFAEDTGGGAFFGTETTNAVVENCTITKNSSGNISGGARFWNGTMRNCILYGNSASNSVAQWSEGGNSPVIEYTCTSPTNGLSNCIDDDPQFENSANGNYRLMTNSPCINTGTNSSTIGGTDLDGQARVAEGTVDLGAYELHVPQIEITNAVLSVGRSTESYNLRGSSSNLVGVIVWSNTASNANGTVTPADAWEIVALPLALENNQITVRGTNALGEADSDSVTIYRSLKEDGSFPVHYVSLDGTAVSPYTNWTTAATSIQDAVDAAEDHHTVLVTNGTYLLSSEISVNNDITIESVNGREVTIVDGQDSTRCFRLRSACTLNGFIIQNGHSDSFVISGGGVRCQSSSHPVITNCTLRNNSAVFGGGSAYGTLKNCIITGNSADVYNEFNDNHGGGCYESTLKNCIITNNTSLTVGGGVSYCTVINSVIADNSTTYYGGGGNHSSLTYCTVVGNSVEDASDPYGWGNIGGGVRNSSVKNCIIWSNHIVGAEENVSGSSVSYSCTVPLHAGTGNISNAPLFVAANDYHLQENSPCIDVGIVVPNIVDDVEGTPRPVDGDIDGIITVDMGAYELDWLHRGDSPVHYVSAFGNAVWPYTNWVDAATNIPTAAAAATVGDTVWVTNGIYDTGQMKVTEDGLTNRVNICKDITVQSVNGPAVTTIDASHAGRGVYLTAGTLSGFTITNGITWVSTNGTWQVDRAGGGLWLGDSATATNCVIAGCEAATGGGAFLYNGGTLSDCRIVGNTANNEGGGVRCEGGGVLENCTLSDNEASGDGGGSAYGISTHCTLSGNNAENGGGSAYGTLTQCILSGNDAGNQGGGSYDGTLTHCTISNNVAVYGGGSAYSTLYNCLISDNSQHGAAPGGGCYYCTVYNSLITRNSGGQGGGAGFGSFYNCTLVENQSTIQGPGGAFLCEMYNCIVFSNLLGDVVGGSGSNIYTNDPHFIDAGTGNYQLQPDSPCIDAGTNAHVVGETDYEGNPRIIHDTVDIGAYEYVGFITDTDGDAFTDHEEYIADTSATDSNDWFHVSSISNSAVYFDSSSNRLYSLLWCSNLVDDVWSPTDSPRMGNNGADSISISNNLPVKFYKLTVEVP